MMSDGAEDEKRRTSTIAQGMPMMRVPMRTITMTNRTGMMTCYVRMMMITMMVVPLLSLL
jgi:hypothetical protein